MTSPDLGFIHVFEPPQHDGAPVLLLLHGTGGNEHALLQLKPALIPEAGILSPRGQVLEQGKPRFFRRLAEGVFDVEDLKQRTHDLAAFLSEAGRHYGFTRQQLIAVGFSNGANIAGSLLLLEPLALAAAIQFRAMVPLVPDRMPSLPGTPVFLSNGMRDPLVSASETERLAELLRTAGAEVTVAWQPAGHELTPADLTQARDWLMRARTPAPPRS